MGLCEIFGDRFPGSACPFLTARWVAGGGGFGGDVAADGAKPLDCADDVVSSGVAASVDDDLDVSTYSSGYRR